MRHTLTFRTKPKDGDTFTANGSVFVVKESDAYLVLEVDAEEVGETLTDAGSYWI